jgi:histidinol-phosphate aminotransferase
LERELGITGAIKLASNENPRGPGSKVRAALARAGEQLSRYPDGSGFRLKRALSAKLGVAPDSLTLGNGSNDVLELIARVALTPGAEGIVSEHAFVVYPLAIVSLGGKLVTVPARDWGTDLEGMLRAVTDRTRIVYVANPNNPTGTWVKRAAIESFLAKIPGHVVVVLDEAYFEYVTDRDYPDGVTLLARHPNLVVTRTFSKVHGLAALRVGYGVSSPALADLMNRVRQPFNVNAVALECAEAALGDDEFVRTSREINTTGLAQLEEGIARLQLSAIPSAGNFLTIDLRRPAAPVYQALLQRGVIVRPVANYGLPNHLRVTVGTPSENERFLRTLAEVR